METKPKFRAYDNSKKKYIFSTEYKYIDKFFLELRLKKWTNLEQFVGIIDINNKEIYENDAIRDDGYNTKDKSWTKIFKVIRRANTYCFEYSDTFCNFFGLYSDNPNQTISGEVVGNLKENPEIFK
jgi:hypothetical protein